MFAMHQHRQLHQKPKYTFDQPAEYGMKAATVAANANTRKHRNRQHQRTSSADVDPTDAGSLTYSTTSSINSTGESTDSSFADIMKVLEMQDPSELSSLPIQERGMTPAEYQAVKAQNPSFFKPRSTVSVTSSLNYSTDGESNFLAGMDLVSARSGQPSDSQAHDGGQYNTEPDPFAGMFAPAEHTDSLKKRKNEKKKQKAAAALQSRSPANIGGSNRHQYQQSHSMSTANTSKQSTGTNRTIRHKNDADAAALENSAANTSSPPPRAPRRNRTKVDHDVCYTEWWMSCFSDTFNDMMPTR